MHVTLINPPLVSQKNDPHTGIIFMPFILAYLSAFLKKNKYEVQIIDAFGENPWQFEKSDIFQIQGLSPLQTINNINLKTKAIIIYYSGVSAFISVKQIIEKIKIKSPNIPTILIENSQAVTAASIKYDAKNLIEIGFDVLLYGEAEKNIIELLDAINNNKDFPKKDGFIFKKNNALFIGEKIPVNDNLDELPFPDWESFPLKNYWSIGYGHGPVKGPYLALLTSRGCPFNCNFCVVPSMNNHKWRARTPMNVVDEMVYFQRKLGVSDFHIEDLNPTSDTKRIEAISKEIIKRKLKINWKFVSGTKIETLNLDTIPLLAKAGCDYISFSPETGAPDLLKKMNKPFNHALALKMTKLMHKYKIYSQACFILGFPGENKKDLKVTRKYIRKLTFAGLDEIAQFITTPIPGTPTFNEITGFKNLSELTFSPKWRQDYKKLARNRFFQYFLFIMWKGLSHPLMLSKNILNIFRGKFDVKMEQAFYRITFWNFRKWKHRHGK